MRSKPEFKAKIQRENNENEINIFLGGLVLIAILILSSKGIPNSTHKPSFSKGPAHALPNRPGVGG